MPSRRSTLFPYTTLFRSLGNEEVVASVVGAERVLGGLCFIAVTRSAPGELTGFHTPGSVTLGEFGRTLTPRARDIAARFAAAGDRKSTRLNSSHLVISYAVAAVYALSLHDALPIFGQ